MRAQQRRGDGDGDCRDHRHHEQEDEWVQSERYARVSSRPSRAA